MNDVATFGGWVIALITLLVAIYTQWRKAGVDQSALVMGEWQKLIAAHQGQISTLMSEISGLRSRLVAAEGRIDELEKENLGLRRIIAQMGQSTAIQLSEHGGPIGENESAVIKAMIERDPGIMPSKKGGDTHGRRTDEE